MTSSETGLHYAFVIPVEIYPLGETRFAVESAFATHLRELFDTMKPRFRSMTVAGPIMSKEVYTERGAYLSELDAEKDRIRHVGLYESSASTKQFLLGLPKTLRALRRVVDNADLIHSTLSHNLWRPVEFPALMLAAKQNKKTISVTDIDNRKAAEMFRAAGKWSERSYLMCKYLYDPIRSWQQKNIVERCSLVLLKGQELVNDYGQGTEHVKFFQDTAYSSEQVISKQELEERSQTCAASKEPLKLTHFGRLEFYKGMHHAIEALARVNQQSVLAELHLIGTGSEQARLEELVQELNAQSYVSFHAPMSYGEAFLEKVRSYDMLIAPSLAPDTPRSAWDAIASGIPILAYDTEYYAQLAERTGAVHTVKWGDIDALASAIRHFSTERTQIAEMKRRTHPAALTNTQDEWLKKRAAWTLALFNQTSPS